MTYRTKLWLLWLLPVGLAIVSLSWLGWQIHQSVPASEPHDLLLLWVVLAAFALIGAATVAWALLDWHLDRKSVV